MRSAATGWLSWLAAVVKDKMYYEAYRNCFVFDFWYLLLVKGWWWRSVPVSGSIRTYPEYHVSIHGIWDTLVPCSVALGSCEMIKGSSVRIHLQIRNPKSHWCFLQRLTIPPEMLTPLGLSNWHPLDICWLSGRNLTEPEPPWKQIYLKNMCFGFPTNILNQIIMIMNMLFYFPNKKPQDLH